MTMSGIVVFDVHILDSLFQDSGNVSYIECKSELRILQLKPPVPTGLLHFTNKFGKDIKFLLGDNS